MKKSPHAAQLKAQLVAIDSRHRVASMPTDEPRPPWMDNAALLPKRPPVRPA
jgi:hypothetical protein